MCCLCLGKTVLLEGIKQRDGANSKQEAKRQEKGRGWGFGGESGCDSNRGVVVRETDGKKGRWEIRIQTQSNPNFFKSDGHGKM